ncbi:MAG: o-succinylbenzoate synthase [Cyanobacteria bacterium J06623_7]
MDYNLDDQLKFEYELYQNQFKQPLRTSHGIWQTRRGIIVTLTDSAGTTSRGEIAPLPWFGSETLTQATEFCRQRQGYISPEQIKAIGDRLPCCQFAFESAYLGLNQPQGDKFNKSKPLNFCYLLPAGEAALTAWQEINPDLAYPTFKWKVGVLPLTAEIELLPRLVALLPPTAKLRLDANGGLTLTQARQLLALCDRLEKIEFIEQPLSPNQFDDILNLSQAYSTPIALDESVASLRQLQWVHQQGWQGIYVIKAAIMGFTSQLAHFCRKQDLDIVFSSVFETEVARQTVLNLAQQLNHPRALGFGVQHLY